jgi:hypothetical protein
MVDITTITDGTIDGAGYFDKIMAAMNAQILTQFDAGRIQGGDFATVYLGALQTALAQAIGFTLVSQQTLTEEAKILDTVNGVAVAGAVGKQKELQQAQIDGFARDAEQKGAKILMDAWQVTKSIGGDIVEPPEGARNDDIEEFIIKLRQGIGITESIYVLAANAGDNQSAALDDIVFLDGTLSTSPKDATPAITITGYSWVYISGPGAPTITNSTSSIASFIANPVGTYIFELTVTASDASTVKDRVTITVT